MDKFTCSYGGEDPSVRHGKKLGITAAIAAGALLLTGCGVPDGQYTVTDKYHNDEWCQVIMISTGKTSYPQITCYPEEWGISVRDNKDDYSILIPETQWSHLDTGERVTVKDNNLTGQ